MSKSLDKMTKSELLAHIAGQDARIAKQDDRLCQAVGSYRALRAERDALAAKLTALENRRKFESITYRKKIKTAAAKTTSNADREARDAERQARAEASREYCALYQVGSVSAADLAAYRAAKSES